MLRLGKCQELSLDGTSQTSVLVRIEVNAVNLTRSDVIACVEEAHLMPLSDSCEIHPEFLRLSLPAGEHVCEAADFKDGWRGDEYNLRHRAPESLATHLDCHDQALHAGSDVTRPDAKASFQIIRPQHQGQDVDRCVSSDHHRDSRQAREVFTLDGVGVNSSTAGQSLLMDLPVGPKLSSDDAGPALIGAKAADVVDVLHGDCSMGVRVAKADKGLGQVLLRLRI
jgi:hypothetical protein